MKFDAEGRGSCKKLCGDNVVEERCHWYHTRTKKNPKIYSNTFYFVLSFSLSHNVVLSMLLLTTIQAIIDFEKFYHNPTRSLSSQFLVRLTHKKVVLM